MSKSKVRIIAYYLPQYHPIPENDKYWGKGFTEWTNVVKAKPLFKGHYQPKVPSYLGYYDLRNSRIREQQAELAEKAGVEGFCYWHYWFGNGKELLERPFNEVVDSGSPDFPFCLGWANHDWATNTWTANGNQKEIIAKMAYPGENDYVLHFNKYLRAFKDKRYIKVDNKLLFVIYAPLDMPDFSSFKQKWNELAVANGLVGFHFVGIVSNFDLKTSIGDKKIYNFSYNREAIKFYKRILSLGYDAINSRGNTRAEYKSMGFIEYYFKKFVHYHMHLNNIIKVDYKKIIRNYYVDEDRMENVYPTVIPNWDRTPRSKANSVIWYNTIPENFEKMLQKSIELVSDKTEEHKIIFLQSWNEWGEGNYVEPDCKYGNGYLDVLKKLLR